MMLTVAQITQALVFISVFLGILAIYFLSRKNRSRVDERIEKLSGGARPKTRTPSSLIRESEATGWGRLLTLIASLQPESLTGSDIRLRLIRAGYVWRETMPIFIGLRVLSFVVIGVLGGVAGHVAHFQRGEILSLVAVSAIVGFLLPDIILWIRTSKRQQEIVICLPDALDLMVICVEAGLGLNAAIMRVGKEFEPVCPPLSRELRLVNREMLTGISRIEALQNMALRTGLEDIKILVAILIQTEQLGTSIANSLRVHADSLRIKRRHRAEEKARKVAVKLVFPLVLFIFPTLMLIILGPGLIRMVRVLSDVPK